MMSTRFVIGMILLTTNQPVGWGGMALCAYLAKKTGKKIYIALGTAVYVLSWGMLFLGAYLAGKEGLELSKTLLKRYGWWAASAALLIIAVAIYVKKNKKKIPTSKGS